MKLYHYPNCSTCKKARTFLTQANISFDLINLAEQAPSVAELQTMLEAYEGNIKKLFNVSGVQYRELDMKSRLASMSNEQALTLLSENGLLVKRPFLLLDKPSKPKGMVGFKEPEWMDILK